MQLISSKKIISGLALAGTIALTGAIGIAQQETAPGQSDKGRVGRNWKRGGHHGLRGDFAGHFAHGLNLTEAQKEQMRQIATRYRESTRALHEQTRQARGGDFGALNGTFDESAVRAAAQTRANARVELEVAHARMMSEMYAILTPEQKAQLAAQRQQWEQKRQERRARRGANSGQIQ